MQIYLLNNNNVKVMPLINWTGGVSSVQIKRKLSSYTEVNIIINGLLGNYYKTIRDNVDVKLELVDNNIDLILRLKKKLDGQVDYEDSSEIAFTSEIYNIKYNEKLYPKGSLVNGVLNNFLNDLVTTTSYIDLDVSNNTNISIESDGKDNYQFFQEVLEEQGLQWRECGIKTIQFGGGFSAERNKIEIRKYNQLGVKQTITNFYSFNNTARIINEIKVNNKIKKSKYYFVTGKAGSGAEVLLNNTVTTVNGYSILQINGNYYINDESVSNNNFEHISLVLSSGDGADKLYYMAVQEIKKRKNLKTYELEIISQKMIDVGDKVLIEYVSERNPIKFESVVIESNYDYTAGYNKVILADEPSAEYMDENRRVLKEAIRYIEKQKTSN